MKFINYLVPLLTVWLSSSANGHPASHDWSTRGGVQVVKNQGSCGSSYAFAAIGALETAVWRKTKTLPNLSEQHLVDCTREYGNGGCQGGWAHTAFQWIQDKGGFIAQSNYPYTGTVGACQHNSKPKAGTVTQFVRIRPGDENHLLDAVATVGSVAVAFNANTNEFNYYSSGILSVPNCNNTPTHYALVTGYGTENGIPFWRLKNSWGTGWGENGYFRMVRGKNMCGIADWASYAYTN